MLSKWFTKFTNKIMELLYVNKVHGYLEIFQKILNSQIVSKTTKWIWKAEIEKTFGKKIRTIPCFGPNLAEHSSSLFSGAAQLGPACVPVHHLPP
jgi:hypothetical protein